MVIVPLTNIVSSGEASVFHCMMLTITHTHTQTINIHRYKLQYTCWKNVCNIQRSQQSCPFAALGYRTCSYAQTNKNKYRHTAHTFRHAHTHTHDCLGKYFQRIGIRNNSSTILHKIQLSREHGQKTPKIVCCTLRAGALLGRQNKNVNQSLSYFCVITYNPLQYITFHAYVFLIFTYSHFISYISVYIPKTYPRILYSYTCAVYIFVVYILCISFSSCLSSFLPCTLVQMY